MGYRSRVLYWFEGKNAQAVVMQYMAEHPHPQCIDELVITDNGVYFECDECKWYDNYEDVQWHNKLFSFAQEMSDEDGVDLCGQFVRVGEERGDVEENTFGDHVWDSTSVVEVYTKIDYSFPTNQKEK
jgi:hypothetical protein